MPALINQRLALLAEDHESGALELSCACVELLRDLSQTNMDAPKQVLLSEFERVAERLYLAHGHMAPIVRILNEACLSIETGEQALASDMAQCLTRWADRWFAESAERQELTVSHSAAEIVTGDTILTYSRSSTVEMALMRAHRQGKRFRVICPESRPVLEGQALATNLVGAGIPVTVVVDAAVVKMLDLATRVILGADAVTESFWVNKVGSEWIVASALDRGLPVLVSCDSSKFLNADIYHPPEDQHDPMEIVCEIPEGMTVENVYFSRILHREGCRIVCERGNLALSDVNDLIGALSTSRLLFRLIGGHPD